MSAPSQSWTHSDGQSNFLISTEKSDLDHEFIKSSFALKDMYWTKVVSDRSLELLINNSCCFGLYVRHPSGLKQIGLARLITDYATLAYLTDVIILEEHQGSGLGKWLIKCVLEVVESMEDLRRFILLTSKGGRAVPFYEGFGMSASSLDEDGLVCMVRVGPGATTH